METWFISDIHLKTIEERNGKILLRFLHSLLEKDPSKIHLFLLGDIFDLWVGGHSYFKKRYGPLISILEKLREHGLRMTYIEGNHDVHIEGFFQKVLGAEVFVEAQYFDIDGLKVRCEHGDLINLDDQTYLKYRALIRGRIVRSMALHLPGLFWAYVGNLMSQKSRKRSSVYRAQNEEQLIKMIRAHAVRSYAEKPFDMIISGHMHVFDDHTNEINGKKIRSVNLGSWFEKEVKVFAIREGKGEWITLPAE